MFSLFRPNHLDRTTGVLLHLRLLREHIFKIKNENKPFNNKTHMGLFKKFANSNSKCKFTKAFRKSIL